MERFSKAGADFNAQNASLETPLHLACSQDYPSVVQLFCKHGSNVHSRNRRGETPLHYAARSGHADVAAALVLEGARLERGEQGSPLDVADPTHPELVHVLLHAATLQNSVSSTPSPSSAAASSSSGANVTSGSSVGSGAGVGVGPFNSSQGGSGNPLSASNAYNPLSVSSSNATMSSTSGGPSTGGVIVLGQSRLAPRQRRVRHLVSLQFRRCEEHLMNRCWLSLEGIVGEAEEKVSFLDCVEGVSNTLNPEWDVDVNVMGRNTMQATDKCSVMRVSLWREGNGSIVLLLRRRVALEELVYIGFELSELHVVFPPKTLIVELTDGYYVSKDVLEAMIASAAVPAVVPPRPMTVESFSVSEFVGLTSAWNLLQEKKQEQAHLASELESALEKHSQDQGVIKAERQKKREMRLHALRMQRDALRAECTMHKDAVDSVREEVKQMSEAVLQGRTEISRRLGQLEEMDRSVVSQLVAQKQQMDEATKHMYRWMIRELSMVYLVVAPKGNDSKGWTIAGLYLPNSDFTGCEQEEIATALGYVCHVVQVVARWLSITLRYEMMPLSSRSVIRNEIAAHLSGSARYPLYARGVDRTRFEYGVFLLNKNLEQVLQSQGIEVERLQNTLPNLYKLYQMFEGQE